MNEEKKERIEPTQPPTPDILEVSKESAKEVPKSPEEIPIEKQDPNLPPRQRQPGRTIGGNE